MAFSGIFIVLGIFKVMDRHQIPNLYRGVNGMEQIVGMHKMPPCEQYGKYNITYSIGKGQDSFIMLGVKESCMKEESS
jgi:hypothetical protein